MRGVRLQKLVRGEPGWLTDSGTDYADDTDFDAVTAGNGFDTDYAENGWQRICRITRMNAVNCDFRILRVSASARPSGCYWHCGSHGLMRQMGGILSSGSSLTMCTWTVIPA